MDGTPTETAMFMSGDSTGSYFNHNPSGFLPICMRIKAIARVRTSFLVQDGDRIEDRTRTGNFYTFLCFLLSFFILF